MRQGLALVVIVGTAHLRDRRREVGAHVVLLLLLLQRVERSHAGQIDGTVTASRRGAIGFGLLVRGRIVVLGGGKRGRRARGRTRIADGLLTTLALLLSIRHRRRGWCGTVLEVR
jgi:hypothetical protein